MSTKYTSDIRSGRYEDILSFGLEEPQLVIAEFERFKECLNLRTCLATP